RDLNGYLTAEFLTLQGGQQAALLAIAAVASLEALGALRGAQILLAPATLIEVAAFNVAVPEISRRAGSLDNRNRVRISLAVSGVIAALGSCWGIFFLIAPDIVGSTLLGATWPGTSASLWVMIIGQFGGATALGPAIMLVAM